VFEFVAGVVTWRRQDEDDWAQPGVKAECAVPYLKVDSDTDASGVAVTEGFRKALLKSMPATLTALFPTNRGIPSRTSPEACLWETLSLTHGRAEMFLQCTFWMLVFALRKGYGASCVHCVSLRAAALPW
jgi:hypothetical protein